MLTNRTMSGRTGSAPNGFSISKWIRSRPSQSTTSALNGRLRSNAARNFALEPGLRQTYPQLRHSRRHSRSVPLRGRLAKRPVPANVDATNENDKSHNQEENLNSSLAAVRIRLRGPLPEGERWHRVLRTLARSEPRTPSGSFVAPGHPKPPRDALCSRLDPQQQKFGYQQN
jgi:hypothetical protein